MDAPSLRQPPVHGNTCDSDWRTGSWRFSDRLRSSASPNTSPTTTNTTLLSEQPPPRNRRGDTVLERRDEIGRRRALGAKSGHVRVQFLTESLLLLGLGGFARTITGIGFTAIMCGGLGVVLGVWSSPGSTRHSSRPPDTQRGTTLRLKRRARTPCRLQRLSWCSRAAECGRARPEVLR